MFTCTFTGFEERVPGEERYTVIGDRNYGVFNLRIVNVSLNDNGNYQCQVGPVKDNLPIRTFANLTVICKYHLFYLLLAQRTFIYTLFFYFAHFCHGVLICGEFF